MNKLFSMALAAAVLTACHATELSTAKQAYNAETQARVRVYGQNGRPATLTLAVNGKMEKITVGGGAGQAFSSMLGVKSNESIGMPETPLSKNPSAHSKLLSGIFFKEFAVPAGSPITVQNHISVPQNPLPQTGGIHFRIVSPANCSSKTVTFTPQAGKDYEVAPASSSRSCGVTVYEIR